MLRGKQSKKCCWIAKQYEVGWRLGFCFGNAKTKWLPFWFSEREDVSKALKLNCVFIHRPKDETI